MKEIVPTYVQGFDEVLGGGIPRGSITLVCGTPGTMKTSLTLSIIYNNVIRNGSKGLFISLEESCEELKIAAEKLGMTQINNPGLYIVDLARLRLELGEGEVSKNWLQILREMIREGIKAGDYDMLAVDSLEALYALGGFHSPRRDLFHFFGFLKDMNVTGFVVAEIPFGSNKLTQFGEDFLADGIFYLKHFEVGDSDVQLRLRCVKMRRVRHDQGYFVLSHQNGSFVATKAILE